jgi:hypothetical protein
MEPVGIVPVGTACFVVAVDMVHIAARNYIEVGTVSAAVVDIADTAVVDTAVVDIAVFDTA